jgi:hypothetical protein
LGQPNVCQDLHFLMGLISSVWWSVFWWQVPLLPHHPHLGFATQAFMLP